MILNNVANDGSVIDDVEFPTTDQKKMQILANKLKSEYEAYQKEIELCGGDVVCEEDKWLNSSVTKFLRELFYTKKNECYKKPTIVNQFTGIMIHSPASHKSGLSTRNDFDQDGKNVDTHFIVDGDTGNIYSLLPLEYKANHCGTAHSGKNYKSFNGSMIAIDIGESTSLSYKGKKDDIIMAKVMGLASASKFKSLCSKEAKERKMKESEVAAEYISKYNAEYKKQKSSYEAIWKKDMLDASKIAAGTTAGYTFHDNRVYYISDYNKVKEGTSKSFDAAAELCAYLCCMLNLQPLGKGPKGKYNNGQYVQYGNILLPNVIISHQEGHVNFEMASNHGDPISIWEASLRSDLTMDTFRQLVHDKMNNIITNNIRHKMFEIIARP